MILTPQGLRAHLLLEIHMGRRDSNRHEPLARAAASGLQCNAGLMPTWDVYIEWDLGTVSSGFLTSSSQF